jgi:hypothetical protein
LLMLQNQRENRIRIHLIGNSIQNISCYTLEDSYFITEDQNTVITNVGLEIQVKGLTFSFGWVPDLELIDFQSDALNKDYEISVHKMEEFSTILNKNVQDKIIQNIEFQWNFYHEADENMEPIGEPNYIPVELLIQFEDGSQLQLAAMRYSFEEGMISDLFFDSQEDILISMNKQLKIDIPEQ